jgi:hypothetical protein
MSRSWDNCSGLDLSGASVDPFGHRWEIAKPLLDCAGALNEFRIATPVSPTLTLKVRLKIRVTGLIRAVFRVGRRYCFWAAFW